ncbi:hypothetical protein ACJRO7_027039 [Eucalyptus globulus]|uniref:Uncharacterized protein n=1 Tax=Eucalyptus globulus TaxID=34317 RepID=A0ABD3K035_EUCGL
MMLMAASFCDVNLGCGLRKLHDFHSTRNGKTRSHAHAQNLCSYSKQHIYLKTLDIKQVKVKRRFKLRQASFGKNAHSSELAKEDDISMATLIWRQSSCQFTLLLLFLLRLVVHQPICSQASGMQRLKGRY